jgi:hypothetical protein
VPSFDETNTTKPREMLGKTIKETGEEQNLLYTGTIRLLPNSS